MHGLSIFIADNIIGIKQLRPLISAVLVSLMLNANAQKYVDLARITYGNTPDNQFDSSDATTRVSDVVIDLLAPVPLGDKFTLLTGVVYERMEAKIAPVDPDVSVVHGATLKLGLNTRLSEKLTGTFLLLPKLSSDLRKLGKKDIQYGGTAILKLKRSENFSWQFGGYYNSELSGPFLVPFLGCYYLNPVKKFEMNVLLPASVDMNYAVTPKLRIGGQFVSFVKSYHINNYGDGTEGFYWNRSTNETFAYVQAHPFSRLIVQMRCGYSVARRYSLYATDDRVDLGIMAFKFGDNRERLNPYFEDGLIFQLRLIYRYNTE